MSSEVAIKVECLSKSYQLYNKPIERLKQMFMWGGRKYYREFEALKDVSFEVMKGETVGVVGRNGSGKSTLLKIICGRLNASGGIIETKGRVAALLELGSGFNPDFTGRENVYMNAAVLGLSRKEIDAKYDEIAAFADIGSFIEHPVKTYSSGMMMRLAFAVAINVEPQILIIDEALSVGDELFQRKCFAKIQKIKEAGATILFVSHSGGAVIELCDRAILLNSGELLTIGKPKFVIGKYQRLLHANETNQGSMLEEIRKASQTEGDEDDSDLDSRDIKSTVPSIVGNFDFYDEHFKTQSAIYYSSNGAIIDNVEVLGSNGEKVNVLKRGNDYTYRYRVQFNKGACAVRGGTMIKSVSGIEIGGLQSHTLQNGVDYVNVGEIIEFSFQFKCLLLPGTYFFNAGVVANEDGGEVFLHRIVDAYVVRVAVESELCTSGIVDFSRTDCRTDAVKFIKNIEKQNTA